MASVHAGGELLDALGLSAEVYSLCFASPRGDRLLRLFASLAFLISAHSAGAQNQLPPPAREPPFVGGAAIPPTDLPSGIGNYCIYESLIYSIGSPICVGKTSFVCAPTTANVGFNQRGYWTPRPVDPNLLVGAVCP